MTDKQLDMKLAEAAAAPDIVPVLVDEYIVTNPTLDGEGFPADPEDAMYLKVEVEVDEVDASWEEVEALIAEADSMDWSEVADLIDLEDDDL